MAIKFVLRDSGSRDYPIGEATAIGRDASCQIILSGDTLVSRRHALVWVQGDTLYVRDESSSNGTFVNGQRLTPNAATPLRAGDKLAVGSTLFLALSAAEAPATVIAPRPVAPAGVAPATAAPVAPPAAAAPAAAAASPAPRRRPAFWMACAVAGVIVLLLLCGGAGLLIGARNPLALAGLPGAGTSTVRPTQTVLSTSVMPPLLTPQQYAASNQDLASAVAALNQAEIDFVQAATGTAMRAPSLLARPALRPVGAPDLESKLLNVAADAFQTATLAGRLSQTAAAQGGGSPAAGQTASQYGGLARMAASLVIDAQNARQGMAQGTVTPKAAASTMAEYGARLWNPSAVSPAAAGDPFTPLLPASAQIPRPQVLTADAVNQLSSQLGGNLDAWLATSGVTVTKTLNVPAASGAAPLTSDPATPANLATAEGQKDASAARAAAEAIVEADGGVVTGTLGVNSLPAGGSVEAIFWTGVAVASPKEQKTGAPQLPAYPNSQASAVSNGAKPDDTLSTLVDIGTGGDVTLGTQTPVTNGAALVNLTISNITVKSVNVTARSAGSTFEADAAFEFDVQWSTNVIAPRLLLECIGGNNFTITTASGSQHVSARASLILYPGSVDAYCFALQGGNTLGEVNVNFLVGDAGGATQRAAQVLTEAANLDLTLTADAVNTQNVESTNAAATQGALSTGTAVMGTQNALETEVAAQQTEEFAATITAIAHLTAVAVPPTEVTPSATPTFVPVVVETLAHPGNLFAVTTKTVLQPNRLYQFCFSGQVFLINPDRAVLASDIDHVNGIKVPPSECLTLEGNGKAATISCGQGEIAQDPGGFNIVVTDLGPT